MPSWKRVIVSGSNAALNSLTVTNGITGSLFGTASYATVAANGGVTQLLAGPNITLSPTNGLGQVTVSAAGGGGSSFNTATGSYGSFYDTTTQTNPVANTPHSMSLNTTAITNGVSISGSTNPFNTYIKTENAGVYNIQFSAQVDKTDGGTDDIVIWLRKNGIDLTDTATAITLPTNNSKAVAAWNWFVNSAANDYYQIIWLSADTDMRLLAEPISGTHPGIPSVIVTANRVDQFLSNTGSFSGSFTGQFTGSLFGTASWANNATSASFATTASFTTAVTGTTNYVSKFTGTNTLGNSQIFDNGTNVGIGTTSPSYKLDLGVSNGMRLGSLNIVDGGSQISSNSSLLRIYSGTGVKLSYFNGTSIVDGFLMNSSGNVGIGTMSPQTRLDVYNGDFSQLKLSNSLSSQQLWFGSVADTIGSFIGNNTRYTNSLQFTPNSSAASGIYFRQDGSTEFFNNTGLTNGVLYTPSVSIKIGNTGNVGIGTTSLGAKLDVNGDGRFQTNLTIGLTTNNNGTRTVFNGSTGARNFQIANNWNVGGSFEITPSTTTAGSTFTTPALVVNGTTSNVGIGTTTPNSKLDVNGNTTITGSLAVSQSLLQYSNIASVTSGSTSNVASFNTSSYTAAFFDYVTTSGTSARAGTVFTVWNGNNVEYTETSTNDIGNTSNLVLSASLSAGAIRLQATSLSGSWSVKTLARMI